MTTYRWFAPAVSKSRSIVCLCDREIIIEGSDGTLKTDAESGELGLFFAICSIGDMSCDISVVCVAERRVPQFNGETEADMRAYLARLRQLEEDNCEWYAFLHSCSDC